MDTIETKKKYDVDIYTIQITLIFIRMYIKFKKWMREHNTYPSPYSQYKQEKKLGKWCITQRHYMRKKWLSLLKIKLLNRLPYWKWGINHVNVTLNKKDIIFEMIQLSKNCDDTITDAFNKIYVKIELAEALTFLQDSGYDEYMNEQISKQYTNPEDINTVHTMLYARKMLIDSC